MATLLHLIRMWLAATIAVVQATVTRLVRGPTLPSWTWMTEWTVAASRAVISVAAQRQDDPIVIRFGLRIRAPIPTHLRRRVDVTSEKLGTTRADHYTRTDDREDAATILYFHGGGYVFGNPGTHRRMIASLVDATHTSAYAARYRLAPGHPYPAAVDDAIAAYRSLIGTGTKPGSIIVAGDSAGGGLALGMTLRARTEGLPMPGGLILFSPYADLRHTGASIEENASTDYLPLAEMRHPNDWYAPGNAIDEPEASPVLADLTGFPPMLIFAGGAEMILDDARRVHTHAVDAGVDATLVIEPEMMHVWPAIVPWQPESAEALRRCAAWIGQKVTPR